MSTATILDEKALYERVCEVIEQLRKRHDAAYGRQPDGSCKGEIDFSELSDIEGELLPLACLLPGLIDALELSRSGMVTLADLAKKHNSHIWTAAVFSHDRISHELTNVEKRIKQ